MAQTRTTFPARDKRTARAQLYRTLILDAAERLFARQGSQATRVQEIARAADLSLATVYNVFSGKDAILAALHERRLAEIFATTTAALQPGRSAADNVLDGLAALARYMGEHPDYLKLHLQDGNSWASAEGIRGDLALDYWRRGVDLLITTLSQAQPENGSDRVPADLDARLLIATVQTWLSWWIAQPAPQPPEAMAARLRAFVAARWFLSTPDSDNLSPQEAQP